MSCKQFNYAKFFNNPNLVLSSKNNSLWSQGWVSDVKMFILGELHH